VANLAEAVLKSGRDTRRVDELGSERKPRKSHITFLENRKVEFCFATVLMTLVQEAGADMIEHIIPRSPFRHTVPRTSV
jgi:hypothetical protein